MDNSGKTHFWTAALGLVGAIVTLLAAIGGTSGFFQGGGTTAGGQVPAPGDTTAAATPSPKTEQPKATPSPSPTVWRQGTLEIPVEGDSAGQVADFDTGGLIRVESTEEAREADLAARDDGDDVLLEPGTGSSGGSTFYARFVAVNDEAAGRNGCAAGDSGRALSTRLRLFTDIEVGSHVCLVTSRGRIAEFELVAAKLNGKQRWVELRYTTWAD